MRKLSYRSPEAVMESISSADVITLSVNTTLKHEVEPTPWKNPDDGSGLA